MEFRILGPLEVLDEEGAIALGGAKQRALLALLILHAGEVLSADRLIDELWGEAPPATAAKTVQVHVSRLRKALEGTSAGGSVTTRDRGYALVADPEDIDALRFERLVADGRGELGAGRPERAVEALESALALWRGAPLADLAGEPFAQAAISRLEELHVAALEELAEARLALGRHAEVVESLEPLIAAHPYRERLRAQQMLALYRCDRQADALQAFQDARARLVDELGIEPGERLRDLERAILAQDPALALVTPLAAQPSEGRAGGAFVGRDAELAELTSGLDAALAGRGGLFLIGGEPGIGKSRLAEQLLGHARARGARVLVGRCWEAGGAPAYWPWVQALRGYVRDLEAGDLRTQLGDGAAELAQILPELHARFDDLPEAARTDSEGARFRLFEATAEFLRNASATRPLVLALDDLHAADASSLLLLRYLARELGSMRLLVLGAYRHVDPLPSLPLTQMLTEVTGEPSTRRIELVGLSRRAVGEYVEAEAGALASEALVRSLHDAAEGNPLFLGEIVRLLAREGMASGAPGERLAIPQSVRDVIARRLGHLPEASVELLELAAVLGREFSVEELSVMAQAAPEAVLAGLDPALAASVAGEMPDAPGRLRFAHVLIRDTLYDRLPPSRRIALQVVAARALESVHARNLGPHLAAIAHHYLEAGPAAVGKAMEYTRRAGDAAASQLAFEEAARHYGACLRLHERSGEADDGQVCELLIALGEALSRGGDGAQAKDAFRRAADLAERTGQPELLARAALHYGGRFVWARAGSDRELVPLLERALAAVGERDGPTRVRLLARLVAAKRDEPEREARVQLAEEALAMARRVGDPRTVAHAIEGYWPAVERPAESGRRREGGDELIALARSLGDEELEFGGREHQIHAIWTLCDRPGVDSQLEAMTRLGERLRQTSQTWLLGTVRVSLALMEGRFDEAEALIAETFELGRRAESWNAHVSQRLGLFILRREQGRLAEVEDVIRRSVPEYPALIRFHCALANTCAELGRIDDARAAVDALLAHHLEDEYQDAEWLLSMTLLADACVTLGDVDAAQRLHAMLSPFQDLYTNAPVEVAYGSVARALGALGTLLGRFDEAERHFEAALAIERAMRARPWIAHAQHGYGEMLLARGGPADATRARELLAEATSGYRALGMESWASRAEGLSDGR